MEKRLVISAYNMYTSGSRAILETFSSNDRKIILVTSKAIKIDVQDCYVLKVSYPLKKFNPLWRLFLDQVYIPLVVLFMRGTDLIVMGNIPPFLFPRAVVFFHNVRYLFDNELSKMELLYFRVTNNIWQRKYLVQTTATAEMLFGKVNSRSIKVIGSPVHAKLFDKCDVDFVQFNKPYLFYPARRFGYKRHDILFDQKLEDLSSVINIVLTIEKPADYIGSFLQFTGNLERQKVLHYLQNSAGLIWLSDYESFGVPIIEAYQLEKPIICVDKAYSRSIIMTDYFFSEEGLFEVLKRFIDDLCANRTTLAEVLVEIDDLEFWKSIYEESVS